MQTYQDEKNRENTLKTKKIIGTLPYYVSDYFTARRSNTTTQTRLSYAYDIRKFFVWLFNALPEAEKCDIKNISLETIEKLNARDIEEYIDYLQTSEKDANHSAGIYRKLSALSSFFDYLYRLDFISNNPCDKVIKPKQIKDGRIKKLLPDEVTRLLNAIEFGCDAFSLKQQAYLKNTRERDLAIAVLLLGTGIRVSECVGLDIKDIDFNNCRASVFRKGGKIQNIPLSDEVIEVLKRYLAVREKEKTEDNALFLSMQKKRMRTQTVEAMVNKYCEAIGTVYRITPHKLRKTYGTELYQETGDIYLVASALGHENINTTKKHYAEQSEDRLREARNAVKLRK